MTNLRVLCLVSFGLTTACSPTGGTTPARDTGVADAAVDSGRDATRPPTDSGPGDGNTCGVLGTCGDVCVDLDVDPANCGSCGAICSAPDHAAGVCAAGSCGLRCLTGFASDGTGCVPAPRLIRPASLSTVSSHKPRFTWELPAGVTSARLQICSDRDCTTEVSGVDVTGVDHVVDPALDPGHYFWRVDAGGVLSPTWQFRVSTADGTRLTAFGINPDFDGDGSGDLAVAAPHVDSDAGRVYIFAGSTTGPAASPTRILRAPAGGSFGFALAAAGDLDGDGRCDLVVGARQVAGVEGRAYVYLGSADGLPATPSIELSVPTGTVFGAAVSAAGDVDADGYGDLLVSSIGDAGSAGTVYLFRGGPSGVETTPSWSMVGEARFGSTLAAAGDLNGDLQADIAIGTPTSAGMDGEVQVFYGAGAGLRSTPDVTIPGPTPTGQFGFAITGAGDTNGDGISELAIAAPNENGGRGRVYIYRGDDTGLDTTSPVEITGLSSGSAFFGHGLAFLGDGDEDGFDDLAVGAFGVDSRSGRVSIHRGSMTGLTSTAASRVDGPAGSGGDFGFSVASAGDTDANGRPDLIVGAPGVDDGVGRAYVYRGAPTTVINNRPLLVLSGPSGGAFGRTLASAGR